MKIYQVLLKVDSLCPNPYSVEEKLRWCYEVSCGIRDNVKREYASVESVVTEDKGRVVLPCPFSQVVLVYVNGRKKTKTDCRTWEDYSFRKGDTVRVVYKSMPEEYVPNGDNVPEEYETEAPAPYDSLYLDYVMAQIAFYQNDMNDYNKFVTMYNQKLADFAASCKQTEPQFKRGGFIHLWA